MRFGNLLPLPLFRSDNQANLLVALFFSDKGFTVQELSSKLKTPYPTLHREVVRLHKFGIISEDRVGNYRFFKPNRDSPIYRPLRDLLEVISGPIPLLKKELSSIVGIEWVALFGSWANRIVGEIGNLPKDIDVLVIGTPEIRQVNMACTTVGKKLGWEVNPVILTSREWMEETPFLRQVRNSGLVPVFNVQDRNRENETDTPSSTANGKNKKTH